MNAHLNLVGPRNKDRQVLYRSTNADLRTREYLTPAEIEKLIKAAKDGRASGRRPNPCGLPPWPARQGSLRAGMVAGRLAGTPPCMLEGSRTANQAFIPSVVTSYAC